jgi:formylglycine-generating enzyme required for sulfatase activity
MGKISFTNLSNKKHSALLLLFLLFSCVSDHNNITRIAERANSSVVVVLGYNKQDELIRSGSGFIIDRAGKIITNRHVLESTNRAEVIDSKGNAFPITSILIDNRRDDLIIVKADIPSKLSKHLKISKNMPVIGEQIIVIGNPMGFEHSVSNGVVSGVREVRNSSNLVQITAPISSGSSGSPVINMKGEVIGVATYQSEQGQNLNFAVSPHKTTMLTVSDPMSLREWSGGIYERFPLYDNIHIDMIFVKGGIFSMGCTFEKESECFSIEKPSQLVELSDFYIGKFEITQSQWEKVMGCNPSYFKDCDNCPVESVTWDDVQLYISRINHSTGKRYRLPTEAEWEYAARADVMIEIRDVLMNLVPIYAGGNINDVAWYTGNSKGKTHPVGKKKPNQLGIYDMSGNVMEWCSDWHGEYNSKIKLNPTGPDSGVIRVFRGGSWQTSSNLCRVSARPASNKKRDMKEWAAKLRELYPKTPHDINDSTLVAKYLEFNSKYKDAVNWYTWESDSSMPLGTLAEGASEITVEELCAMIRNKYNAYHERDDLSLALAFLRKYPQYKKNVDFKIRDDHVFHPSNIGFRLVLDP